MKYQLCLISLLAVSSFGFTLPKEEAASPDTNDISGGSISFSFLSDKELENFDLYSELSRQPSVMDGSLYAWVMCEQKVVLKNYQLSSFVLDTHIKTINPSGKIDCGFFFGGSNFSDKKDGENAWNVNVEHDVNKKVFALKLHRFSQGVWAGAVVEKFNVPYVDDGVHLKIAVNNGVVAAYVNDYVSPTFTYDVGESTAKGLVGLRSFYAPNYFLDFTVTAPEFAKDLSLFNAEYQKDLALDSTKYTPSSFAPMDLLLKKIASLDLSEENQIEIDALLKTLIDARGQLMECHSFDELKALISSFSNITNNGKYTLNSFASFEFALAEAKKLTTSSSIDDISYWYSMLQAREQALVLYAF